LNIAYHIAFLLTLPLLLMGSALATDFSFSESEANDKADEQQAQSEARELINSLMATPCSKNLKDKKTAIIISERSTDGGYVTNQSNYGLHFAEINRRLKDIGLRTYTQEEIKGQIRAAEVKAFMENDPDAQMSAASRLGASFILRGLIESRTTFNPVAKVNEVHLSMSFTLVAASGKSVASVSEEAESWAGSDTTGAALALVKEKADLVVAKLYSEYCENAK